MENMMPSDFPAMMPEPKPGVEMIDVYGIDRKHCEHPLIAVESTLFSCLIHFSTSSAVMPLPMAKADCSKTEGLRGDASPFKDFLDHVQGDG